MPKAKQFLKDPRNKKKSKHSPSCTKNVAQGTLGNLISDLPGVWIPLTWIHIKVPSSADEYLAAGVDLEEAAEKWRGGDAVKSTRFFLKAVGLYDEALKKFPQSFDLAYNKARVQYELTQHPKLLAQLPGTLTDLLHMALQSSKFALSLRQDNADVLFNAAQCLTSLVEATSQNPQEEFQYLEEAIELFQRCLSLQELNYEECQTLMNEPPDVEDQSSSTGSDTEMETNNAGKSIDEERWASIIEPITIDTLLDTIIALLETLTTFCNLLTASALPSPPKTLARLEEFSTTLLDKKLPAYLSVPSDPIPDDRQIEAFITRANFLSALGDATFRAGGIDIQIYALAIDSAFTHSILADHLPSNPESLCSKAEALINFNTTVRLFQSSSESHQNPSQNQAILTTRWKALTTAISALTTASKIPDAENLVKIHLARGDVEMLRFQLGEEGYAAAVKNGSTLLKNAATFYRGAAAIARLDEGSWKEELSEAEFKEAVAKSMAEGDGICGGEDLGVRLSRDPEGFGKMMGDMFDEGLVGGKWAEELEGRVLGRG